MCVMSMCVCLCLSIRVCLSVVCVFLFLCQHVHMHICVFVCVGLWFHLIASGIVELGGQQGKDSKGLLLIIWRKADLYFSPA